jgi:hypothetical protein
MLYVPVHLQVPPNPDHAVSLFLLISFTFLDPLIFAYTHVKYFGLDMIPSQVETDILEALRPLARHFLDSVPDAEFRGGKPRRVHVLWGLLSTLYANWSLQALLHIIYPVLCLGVPMGTNRLLVYLETGGVDAIGRP